MKLDLHVHTKEVSPCGVVGALDIVENYIEKGFDGIVITDHFRKSFFENGKTTDDFLNGYKIAKEAGDKKGLKVYLGMELKLTEHEFNEYLVYGIDEAFLYQNKKLYECSLKEATHIIHKAGGIIIQAHPFRNEVCFPRDEVDGYEVFNGHFCHRNHNERAFELANKLNKLQTSGSDTHWIYDTANGGIELERLPAKADLAKCLLSRPKLITSPMQHIKIGVISDLKDIKKLSKTDDLDAIISFAPVAENSLDIPIFTQEIPFEHYFEKNRYTILNNKECSNPFDPSVSFCASSGTTTLVIGEKEEVFRENGHYTVTLQKNKLSVIEFFGYRPIIA